MNKRPSTCGHKILICNITITLDKNEEENFNYTLGCGRMTVMSNRGEREMEGSHE